jgi:hypothetical protein
LLKETLLEKTSLKQKLEKKQKLLVKLFKTLFF